MKNDEMDPRLKQAFSDLQHAQPRDPLAAQSGRAKFLQEAAVIRESVSRQANQRHNRWKNNFIPPYPRKERLPVMNAVLAVILALAVLLGGGGATVYAAQDSLPDQALYPVKILSEDVILSLSGSAEEKLSRILDFSDNRLDEMIGLLATGEPIPQTLELRYQAEIELALQLAAGMEDAQAIQNLEKVRTRADTQLQIMNIMMALRPDDVDPALLRTQSRLQEQIQLALMGEADPQELRLQVQQSTQNQPGTGGQPTEVGNGQGPAGSPTDETPGQNGPGAGLGQPTGTPGSHGNNPQPTQPAQQPGSGSGSGTGSGSGNGSGNQP